MMKTRTAVRWSLIAWTAVTAGCATDLNTEYGQMSGAGAASVNGTSVLADLFEKSGHTVAPAYRLYPKLRDKADCIVWFPDSFDPPKDEVYGWFQRWLNDNPDRTLIYVGRDYDAAITYWQRVLPTLPNDSQDAREMRIELNTARNELIKRRAEADKAYTAKVKRFDDYDEWFEPDFTGKPTQVKQLNGADDWTKRIDAGQVEIELATRLHPYDESDVLLESAAGDELVSVVPWGDGRIILVTNGSFLLNAALVNHEHRKLAGRLVDEIGTFPQHVVFLESGQEGPYVSNDDDPQRTGLEILTIPPFDMILLHLAIAGVIFGFTRWPVFGRAQSWIVENASDFGQHIAALGRLMQATRNRAYAEERLRQYQQLPRHDLAGSKSRSARRGTR